MKGQPLRGGDVTAFSQGGGSGSEFVLRLPILIEAAPQPPVPGSGRLASTPPRARRILVADDNEDAATTLAQLLDVLGHQTRIAFDGEAAVEAALAFRPDLALLDIGMPRFNGYAVARKLREQPWGTSMVLVALTGWGQEDDRRQSGAAGFDHHLVKPVDFDALLQILGETAAAPGPGRQDEVDL